MQIAKLFFRFFQGFSDFRLAVSHVYVKIYCETLSHHIKNKISEYSNIGVRNIQMIFLEIKEVPMKKILAPSILSADFANLGRDVLTAIDAGAEYVHMECSFHRFLLEIL